MNNRWRQIEELYHAAREQPTDRRAAFLEHECAGNSALRIEVESLLARDGRAAGALDRVAWDGMGGLLNSAAEAPLTAGSILGPYPITGALGAGGMGQVYRAHDSRLGRSVAIKILHGQHSGRFQREARAIAALNHPNVCTLHDVGANYLVMELVDGPTLAERIGQGRLPFNEALAIARQIGAALEAAHERGIVHRDLKPANIKILADGTVKVLDFGLAKIATVAPVQTGEATAAMSLTQAGTAVETPYYMAPEKAQGKPVEVSRKTLYQKLYY